MRRTLAVLCLALATACGSTVQLRGQATSLGGADQLGTPASTAPGTTPLTSAGVAAPGTSLSGNPATNGSASIAPSGATATVSAAPIPANAPVTIGIRIPNRNAGAIVGNLTGSSLDTGDPKSMATAVVNWINAHGGLAGHRIVPVFYENCAPEACDLTVQDQQVCATFTQDHKAIAMIDSTETSVALASCLARAGTAAIGGGAAAFDTQDFRTAQGLWSPYLLATDIAYTQLVHRLAAMGWFAAGEKIGMLVDDTPTFRRTAAATTRAMAAVGKSFSYEAYWSGSSNDMSGIVLQFKSRDIKRIVIVDAGSTVLLQLAPAASAQGYYPKYTVTSADIIGTLALIENKQTLDGAAGIGWLPAADGAPNAPAPNGTARLCAQIYKAAQVSDSGPLAAAFASTYCDGLLFARAAYARADSLSLGALRAAVASLGSTYLPAATFSDEFAVGRYDGTATTRDVRYDGSCSCFRYTSGATPVA